MGNIGITNIPIKDNFRMIKNGQEIKIEISQCASKRKCEQKFKDQVKTVPAGMNKTKASLMKNWIEKKYFTVGFRTSESVVIKI